MILHLFPSGQIEVPKPRKGKPCSYRWTTGWSQVTLTGYVQSLTLKHWREIAKRDGDRVKLHKTEVEAREALKNT